MSDYPSNSYKSREENTNSTTTSEKKVEKVVSGKVRVKKESPLIKLFGGILSDDISNVVDYAWHDILIPTAKKTLYEIIKNGSDMIIFGSSSGRERGKGPSTYVEYRNYYNNKDRDREYQSRRERSASYSYDSVLIDSRGEAEEVLAYLEDMLDKYGMVSINDYYESVGITGNYTDCKYGWTNLRSATVVRTSDGYTIKLPKAIPLN